MNKFDGIIFDLDGTLWNATEEIALTWNNVLLNYPQVNKIITIDDLSEVMGMLLYDIAAKLFSNVPEKKQHEIINKCCEEELKYLEKEGAKLYPNLETTLQKLSNNYKLFIVSNCQEGYIEAFLKAHNLSKYFMDFECPGTSGLAKAENNKLIIKRNNLKNAVYIGDTQNDCNSAKSANIPFIFASYGFGNVKDYDYIINKFEDIIEVLK